MKCIFRTVGLLILLLIITGCGGGGGDPTIPNGQDNPITLLSQNIGPDGGEIMVQGKGSGLDNTSFRLNQGSVENIYNFRLAYYDKSNITPSENNVLQVSKIIRVTSDYNSKLLHPLKLTIPYDKSIALNEEGLVALYLDNDYNTFSSSTIESIDIVNGLITIHSSYLGDYVILYFTSTRGNQNLRQCDDTYGSTDFSPDKDGFFINNFSSFDSLGGNCLGMAVFSTWYYGAHKNPPISDNTTLFNKWRHGRYLFPYDDIVTHELVINVHNNCSQFSSILAFLRYLWDMTDIPEIERGKSLITSLRVTRQPQILCLANWLALKAHAITVYKYEGDYTSGTFYCYDSNIVYDEYTRTTKIKFDNINGFEDYEGYNDFWHEGITTFTNSSVLTDIYNKAESGFKDNSMFPKIEITSHIDGQIVETPAISLYGNIIGGDHPETTMLMTIYNDTTGTLDSFEAEHNFFRVVTLIEGENKLYLFLNKKWDEEPKDVYYAASVEININYVVGTTGNGNLIWAKRVVGSSYDWGSGITTLSDNSTVVTGYFRGTATFGLGETNQTILTSAGYDDIFIARYNQNGTLAWTKRAGGSSGYPEGGLGITILPEGGLGITTLSDNSTVVTGDFYGTATFGPGEANQTVLTSAGCSDIFIARYNPNGTLAWAKSAEGSYGLDYGLGITTLSDNSTVVTGNFWVQATFGPGETNQTFLSDGGLFIARYNPDGTLEWAKRARGSTYDWGLGITTLSDNSTVVTGYFRGTTTFGPGEPNETVLSSAGGIDDYDIFIARYNTNGTLAWARRAGGSSWDGGCAITTLSDNSTVVTGWFSGSATFGPGELNQTVLTSASGVDIFITRYNPDGTLAWAKRAGGSNFDFGQGITMLMDNSIVVTGRFYGTATFGPSEVNQTVLTSAGGYCDIFIARYNPNGTLAWAKHAGGSSEDWGWGITTLSDNSTVVAGRFSGSATFGPSEPNQTVLTSAGDVDIFIARFAP